mgnify:CR=1 FL=1
MTAVIETSGLARRYGEVTALDGIDLTVDSGSVVGLLGPNGAGKTTLVEILEGLREPSEGRVSVFGSDPRDAGSSLRERIGVQLQRTSFPDTLSVTEILELFRSFYRDPVPVDELLDTVQLREKARARPGELSGGQRQRLALATALVGRPELLILDEPTAGLDPGARRSLHELIRGLQGDGRTILLTTHYTEEAEKLCDRILVLSEGELVADGSPLELVKAARGESRIWVEVEGELDPSPLVEAGAREDGREGAYRCFRTREPARAIEVLGTMLRDQDLDLEDLRVKRPTLEDVYLELVEGGEPPRPSELRSGSERSREAASLSSTGDGRGLTG